MNHESKGYGTFYNRLQVKKAQQKQFRKFLDKKLKRK